MSAQPIPVLLYHSVSDQPSPAIRPFYVTPGAFERHLDLILEAGLHALTVSALAEGLSQKQPLPQNPVIITFDDGFADTLEVAAPRLWCRRLTATVYLTTGFLAGRRPEPGITTPGKMLDWSQVGDLEAAGLEVGAHSHSHPHLDVLPRPLATDEIRRSKELLEAHLGHRVGTFAYPHGYTDRLVRSEVQSAGFDSACGVRNALSHAFDDRWCIARLTVRANTPVELVASWLRGEYAPVAGPGEALRTRAWRKFRQLSRLTSNRAESGELASEAVGSLRGSQGID